jgi:methyltransferase
MIFVLFISFVILLRIGELVLSKRNEKWLIQNGALEYGQIHYPFIVLLHVLFFISLIVEYSLQQFSSFILPLLLFYFLLIIFKAWTILSLGKYWNTKIFHIPNAPLIKQGPYKYIKHPNYLIVILEIAVIPLIFHLYFTAIIFTILNLIMILVRIKEENKVLHI